jgi:hypothetical protein
VFTLASACSSLFHDRCKPKTKHKALLGASRSEVSSELFGGTASAPAVDPEPSAMTESAEAAMKIASLKSFRGEFDKDEVLAEYQSHHQGDYPTGIVTSKRGKRVSSYQTKLPNAYHLVKNCGMKPSADKYYRSGIPYNPEHSGEYRRVSSSSGNVKELQLQADGQQTCDDGDVTMAATSPGSNLNEDALQLADVAVAVTKFMFEYGDYEIIDNLARTNSKYLAMVTSVWRLRNLCFKDLLLPRLDYKEQVEIQQKRVDMATACLIHFNMNPGSVVRFIGGEYTGEERDVQQVLSDISGHVSDVDLEHIRRILTEGCPARMHFEEPTSNKLALLERGNQRSFEENPEVSRRVLNKEDKRSHFLPLQSWVPYFSPYCRHNSQGINKGNRVVWDASTKRDPFEIVLNEVTDTELEAEISFGSTKMEVCKILYNIRASCPDTDIYLALADVTSCYRYPRIHPDLTGCFGFSANNLYFLATSMVFGSSGSAPSWEGHRRAIEALSEVFYTLEGLVEKHKEYLDMLEWDITEPAEGELVRAVKCSVNKGFTDEEGNLLPIPSKMYVDDAIPIGLGIESIKKSLAAIIEAIFVVMGRPDERVRPCHLSLEKWIGMIVSTRIVFVGLQFDTRRLTVGITTEYRAQVYEILVNNWAGKSTFLVQDMQKLVGKLTRLGEGASWVYKLMSHLYASLAYALQTNKDLLRIHSDDFRTLCDNIKKKHFLGSPAEVAKQVRFAMKKAARQTNRYHHRYPIVKTMKDELEFFTEALHPDSGISFETPLGLVIPRTPYAKLYGDSSLTGCGGYSIKLGIWWHLGFPLEVVKRTLLYVPNGTDESLISINVLEYVVVILNYCAALETIKALSEEGLIDDPNPIVLGVTDNRSALNWTIHTSKKSIIGRVLARFFCALLMDSAVGINSKWIATDENEIADQISRLKKSLISPTNPHPSYDYTSLQKNFPELRACRSFQFNPELLSLIWQMLLTRSLPDLGQIAALKQQGLGKLAL